MSIIEFKSSLALIWFRIFCFFIEIYCHIENLGFIRYFDSSNNEKTKELSLILCLIIVALTIVGSSVSTVLNCFQGFGNTIEDFPFYTKNSKKNSTSLPWLTLFDIHVALFILLPKTIIQTELIRKQIHDQNLLFESSIDFLLGNGAKRIKKEGIILNLNENKSYLSFQFLNFILILIRYNFIYSNLFYKINKRLNLILLLNSLTSFILCLITYSTFEILFKQISFVNNSISVYSFLLISSLMISIFLILLTNHCLFHFGIMIFTQQQFRISNQLIRLSNLDDRYLITKKNNCSLIFYVIFVFLGLICQIPFLILTFKLLLSGLIDNLLIIYLTNMLIFILTSICLFSYLCLTSSLNFNSSNQLIKSSNRSKSIEVLNPSNLNVEEKLFEISTPNLNRTRTVSSCGLTVIDNDQSSRTNVNSSTFEQTSSRRATDDLLVMH